jgi:hypothetical protein
MTFISWFGNYANFIKLTFQNAVESTDVQRVLLSRLVSRREITSVTG